MTSWGEHRSRQETVALPLSRMPFSSDQGVDGPDLVAFKQAGNQRPAQQARRANFIHLAAIQIAEVTVSMNPHGVHMRQLLVQRKMLNLKDSTPALLAKSHQWRDTGKFRQPESRGRIA
jgi:hypothetical protein